MSDAASPPQLVLELKVSAHLMQLEAGIYCVYHSPGSTPPDAATGLPGARVSLPPNQGGGNVVITGFSDDGWLGTLDSAAMIRVTKGTAQVLMTIYQAQDSEHEPPRLQVTKLAGGLSLPSAASLGSIDPVLAAAATEEGEIAAHLQSRGDVLGQLGEWVGVRGSQRWVEGFSITPRHEAVMPTEIEYQAVLGRGWLSPWAEGGQYCGSRGMALPILGLRVRLRGDAALTHSVEVSASFTDGTSIGPVGPGEPCDAASLAPLEAFCVTVVAIGEQSATPGVDLADDAVEAIAAKGKRHGFSKEKDRPSADKSSSGKSSRKGR